MPLPSPQPVTLTNWSKSARSACLVLPVRSADELAAALAGAAARGQTVIAHGAGHSYTDAALNSGGLVLDLRPMNRILSWEPATGRLRAEAGVTLRQVVALTAPAGWWPAASPSTPEVTLGGCAAMNVTGRNAWQCDPFGGAVLELEVMLPSGEQVRLTRAQDGTLLRAFVGSLGLLGVTTALTLQLQRIPSSFVDLRRRPARCVGELLAALDEEAGQCDFMEAWLDGRAGGAALGRGIVTSATLSAAEAGYPPPPAPPGRAALAAVRLAARLARPLVTPGVAVGNRANYARDCRRAGPERQSLFDYTYWPDTAAAGYHALLPRGVETVQAFVPRAAAGAVFERMLRASQAQGAWPIWCIVKRHRRDGYLLSYQLDGFSLELVYQRRPAGAPPLAPVLRGMMAMVIEAGGRFYLAKDGLLTRAQFAQSVGAPAVAAFLALKQRYDPQARLQSDLFQRLFRPPA